jgi:hypothetical protein
MRIELELDAQGVALLEELKALTGLKQHKEFFNNAITLFDWAVLQAISGRIVASMDEKNKNYKELIMPPIEYAARLNPEKKTAAIERRRGASVEPTESEVNTLARSATGH